MNITTQQWLTLGAPAAVIVAAALAALAGYVTAALKLRELRLADELKTRAAYLANARSVAGEVYVPLAIALAELSRAYNEFRLRVDFELGAAPTGSVRRFKGSCNRFIAAWTGLLERGASAYLTLPLEEEIADFALFLQESLEAHETTRKLTLSPHFYGGWAPTIAVGRGRAFAVLAALTKVAAILIRLAVFLPFAGVELRSKEEIVASPITSRQFETRFQESALEISALIKEVTLGGRLDQAL